MRRHHICGGAFLYREVFRPGAGNK
jgi:hypothetical protein